MFSGYLNFKRYMGYYFAEIYECRAMYSLKKEYKANIACFIFTMSIHVSCIFGKHIQFRKNFLQYIALIFW